MEINQIARERHQANNTRMNELCANTKMQDTNLAIQSLSSSLSLALACLKHLNS